MSLTGEWDNIKEEGKLKHGFLSTDELQEIDLGDGDNSRPTYISKKLSLEFKEDLPKLFREYQDCFAREYHEMLGLSRSIIEHWFPIKPQYRPYK
jgi:hypothetical protein